MSMLAIQPRHFFLFVLILAYLLPLSASAAPMYKPFEVSGWIPYWRAGAGVADALQHVDTFTEINPFVYSVKTDGTIVDKGTLNEEPWVTLRAQAKVKNIRFVPSIMWSNSDAMHAILSNTKQRIALEDRIVALVKENSFDGIDIDFEGKKAADRDYFSTFLKGLYMRMGKKWVMCTIEARTPVADRYAGTTPPPDATLYANDYAAINKYCDRVRIMAYDQQGIDLALANTNSNTLYAPVGDPKWVEKVVNLAAKSISKKKIVIGVPTYGYEYDVTAYADGYIYDILWTFNPGYAIPLASLFNVIPVRVGGNEIGFSYTPTSTNATAPVSSDPLIPTAEVAGTMAGDVTATLARYAASSTNTHSNFHFLSWPDAQSIADKVALAKRLGVRGVAVFKIDGGEDMGMWSILK